MPKTNKERLQDNNTELQSIKTEIDNLPEYQNIELLYYTQNFTNYDTNTDSTYNLSSWYKNYFSIEKYSNSKFSVSIKTINNDSSITTLLSSTTSAFKYFILINVDNEYIYYLKITYEAWITTLPVYKYKLDKSEDEIKLFDITIPSSSIYNWIYSPFENRLVIGSTSNTVVVDVDLVNSTYTTIFSKNIGGSLSYTKSLSPNTLYNYYNGSSTDTKHNRLYYIFNNNISFRPSNNGKINFVNYNEDKILIDNTMYYFNTNNFTLGEKIRDNCIEDFDITSQLFPVSSNYYYSDKGVLYSYDDTTTTFEKIYATNTPPVTFNSTFSVPYYVKDNKYHYFFGAPSTDLYAYKINGITLFLHKDFGQVDNRLTNNVPLYDYYGNVVTGTMPNNGELNYTPSTSQQTIPAGYTSGGTIAAVSMSESDIEQAINQAEDILD